MIHGPYRVTGRIGPADPDGGPPGWARTGTWHSVRPLPDGAYLAERFDPAGPGLRDEALRRIAAGLDVPSALLTDPQTVRSSHWSTGDPLPPKDPLP